MRSALFVAFLAGVSISTSTMAADPYSDSLAAEFDVAGMKLGMSPQQIRSVLTKAGFKVNASDPTQDDWEARITREVAKRRGARSSDGKVPLFTMAHGSRGERIEVWYGVGPEGARASSISFRMSDQQITKQAFRAAVEAKYGKPSNRGWGSDLLYCSKGEAKCVPWSNKNLAYLEADREPLKIYLSLGWSAREIGSAKFQAEVDRRAPKDAPATF